MIQPPYGKPPVEIVMKFGDPMKDWSGTKAEWDTFFDTLCTDIAAHIWPKWEPGTGWVGDAAQFADDMTNAELQLCVDAFQKPDINSQIPPFANGGDGLPERDYFWHYALEDAVGPQLPAFIQSQGARYLAATGAESRMALFSLQGVAYYDTSLKNENMRAVFGRMFTHKYDGLFQTKLVFRRPRPTQTAFMFGIDDFTHHQCLWNAHTGNHPALISGHGAQGFLYMCTLLEKRLAEGKALSDLPLDAYRQFACDVGDRRVFSGVHYPTDNIASWISVLRVLPSVFSTQTDDMRRFVRDSIRDHSQLYKAMSGVFPQTASLAPAWDLLQAELNAVPDAVAG